MNVRAAFLKKIGPLPAWAWAGVVAGAFWFGRRFIGGGDEEITEETPIEDSAGFPAGQLRPVTGEHVGEFPPSWWPTLDDPLPVVVQPPAPLPDNQPPTAGLPSFRWGGRLWYANQRSAFGTYLARQPGGYKNLREWIYGVKPTKKDKRRLSGHLSTARRLGWA